MGELKDFAVRKKNQPRKLPVANKGPQLGTRLSIEDILHRYMGAFELSDRQMLEDVISSDFVFTSPEDDHIDRAAFFQKYWDSGINKAIFIERVIARGNEAYVQYCMEQVGNKRTRKVGFATFNENQIEKICVYVGQDLSNIPIEDAEAD